MMQHACLCVYVAERCSTWCHVVFAMCVYSWYVVVMYGCALGVLQCTYCNVSIQRHYCTMKMKYMNEAATAFIVKHKL